MDRCGGVGPIWLCVKSPWLILLGGVVAGVEYTSLSSPVAGALGSVFCCGVVVFGCVPVGVGVLCPLWVPSMSTLYVSGAIVIRCSLGCVACLVISIALYLSIWLGSGLLCQNVPSLTRLSESVSPTSGCLRVLLRDCHSAMFYVYCFCLLLCLFTNWCISNYLYRLIACCSHL